MLIMFTYGNMLRIIMFYKLSAYLSSSNVFCQLSQLDIRHLEEMFARVTAALELKGRLKEHDEV